MNENPEYPTDSIGSNKVRSGLIFLADFSLTLLVFFLFAGNSVPEVNEPHYWTKAAHYWNPAFGQGDLFLESGDVHWAFYWVFGWLTLYFPLEQAVWIGRWGTWVAIALGWTYLVRAVFSSDRETDARGSSDERNISVAPVYTSPRMLVAAASAPLWLAGVHWGNWAGEWVIGGCESKGIAYAFFFLGIGLLTRARWTLGWTCIGIGSAFHVVTGLWVIATVGLASMLIQLRWERMRFPVWFRCHALGWALCLAGFLAGAVPAMQMDLQTAKDDRTQAAVAQVYQRLGHHLSPTRFSETRWRGLQAMIGVSAFVLLLTSRAQWNNVSTRRPQKEGEDSPSSKQKGHRISHPTSHRAWGWIRHGNQPFQWIFVITAFAFACACIGLLIDYSLSSRNPTFASSLLRFYWFRWNEVVWPLCLSIVVIAVSTRSLKLFAHSHVHELRREFWRKIVASLALIASIGLIWERTELRRNETIPNGERQNFTIKSDTPEAQQRQFEDWIAVCDWIVQNADGPNLWLTPRRQQSFKWRTGKAELACWKDMPQNAAAVVEWNERIQAAYKYENKLLQPLDGPRLLNLADRYGLDYVLLDLRVKGQTRLGFVQSEESDHELSIGNDNANGAPDVGTEDLVRAGWELVYPTHGNTNASFAVLKVARLSDQ